MALTETELVAIQNWGTTQNMRNMHSFLGFPNYYRRFIQNFAEFVGPPTDLKKDKPWQWVPIQQKALKDIKDTYCVAPVLFLPNPRFPYVASTNASSIARGEAFLQDHGEGFRPVAFTGKRFMPTEHKYWGCKCELAAMAYCLQSYQHYLEGCLGGTTILMDHQILICSMDQPILTQAQTKWMKLGLFHSITPTIKYNARKAIIVADALNRSQREIEEN